MNMLEFQKVSFQVDTGNTQLEIINEVSFTVNSGEFLVVTGPNGGGKSTVARLIMGIEKPTAGKILLNGQDITGMSIPERARLGVGYAFQQPPRFKGLTIQKLLSLAQNGEELRENECCDYLGDVGLCPREYAKREMDASLSGGEMKRVEIASLMARRLKLAIFDEPEAGIDLWSFSMLVESFRSSAKRRHEAVIIISHQERIMQLADRILILANGRVAGEGTRDEMLPQLLKELDSGCSCPAAMNRGEVNIHG